MEIDVYRKNSDKQNKVCTITRKPFIKGFFGNFVPHYCRYKRQVYMIQGSIDYAYMHGYEEDAYIVIK